MPEQKIEAHKITKPIQLLAAWLVGLILVNGSFLATAKLMTTPSWVSGLLTIAAIANVPIFLVCIFLLQTRFRPEMQEDIYYAKYLENKISPVTGIEPIEPLVESLRNDLIESNKFTIGLLRDLGDNIKLLADNVESFSIQAHIGEAGQSKQLDELEQRLISSKKDIEIFEKSIDWQKSYIEINDLIPDYSALMQKLAKEGIIIKNTFGSTSGDPEIPKLRIISFGNEIDINHLRKILPILMEFQFEYINYADLPYNEGHIYIGSYVYNHPKEFQIHKLNPELIAFIMDEKTNLQSLIDRLPSPAR